MNRFALLALTACAAILSAPAARAVVLDWDTVSWTAGSLNNSYDIDPTKAGNDIHVNVSGDTGQFVPKGGSAIPGNLNIIEGGLSPVENSLVLHIDLADQTQGVMVSVSFNALYTAGVNNVSFTIFDVDYASGAFQDQLRSIRGLSIDGVTLIAPTITTAGASSTVTVTGSGINQVVDGVANNSDMGATSGNGNVTISFGNNAIQSFTFVYGSGSTAPADPTAQGIALHDISFTPIPEMNPAWISIFSCLAATGFVFRHRGRARK